MIFNRNDGVRTIQKRRFSNLLLIDYYYPFIDRITIMNFRSQLHVIIGLLFFSTIYY